MPENDVAERPAEDTAAQADNRSKAAAEEPSELKDLDNQAKSEWEALLTTQAKERDALLAKQAVRFGQYQERQEAEARLAETQPQPEEVEAEAEAKVEEAKAEQPAEEPEEETPAVTSTETVNF